MNNEHPITPPPELVQQWLGEYFGCTVSGELLDLVLWGSCGIGRDIHVVMKPAHD